MTRQIQHASQASHTRQVEHARQIGHARQSGLTVPKWAGNIGWNVNLAGVADWHTYARVAGDVANVNYGSVATTIGASANQLKSTDLNKRPSLQLGGSGGSPTTTVDNTHLGVIDTALQAADGASTTEWIIYGDDAYSGTVAQHITNLQTSVDFIHNYTRANSAPAFKCLYIPAGTFLYPNLAANSVLATYPDGVLFQSQPYQDQYDGANATYLTICQAVIYLLRSYAPSHPAAIQIQAYSKNDDSIVWPLSKLIADTDAVGYYCNPSYINHYYGDTNPDATATATATFASWLAYYRP